LFDNADELDDKAPKLMNFSNCGAPEIGLPEEGGNQITNSGGAQVTNPGPNCSTTPTTLTQRLGISSTS
jgi:hypothetical protein